MDNLTRLTLEHLTRRINKLESRQVEMESKLQQFENEKHMKARKKVFVMPKPRPMVNIPKLAGEVNDDIVFASEIL